MEPKEEIEKRIRKQWDGIPMKGILPYDMKSLMWEDIRKATIDKRRRNYRWVAAACAVLIVSLSGYWSLSVGESTTAGIVATQTFQDDIRLLRLPDGSRAWVNQNTVLEYPEAFAGDERTVTLTGEAFFEVAKDSGKPFIITSGKIKTTVLGTSFNVKAYAGAVPEVSVRTGKVKVQGKWNRVFLERGAAAQFNPVSMVLTKHRASVLEPEWKKVLIDVNGLTLEEVVGKLQPLKSFSVDYANEDLKSLQFEGTLDTRQRFDKIIQTIAFALELKITPVGDARYAVSK